MGRHRVKHSLERNKMKKKQAEKRKQRQAKSKKEIIALPEYYQIVWAWIHQNSDELLRQKNITEPRHIRRTLVMQHSQEWDDNNLASQYGSLFEILQCLEDKLRDVISRHSVLYWLHIYRRIAPLLSPHIGSRADPITALETRAIAEQAIFKYGDLSGKNDIVLSSEIDFDNILGGLLKQVEGVRIFV